MEKAIMRKGGNELPAFKCHSVNIADASGSGTSPGDRIRAGVGNEGRWMTLREACAGTTS